MSMESDVDTALARVAEVCSQLRQDLIQASREPDLRRFDLLYSIGTKIDKMKDWLDSALARLDDEIAGEPVDDEPIYSRYSDD